LYTNRANLEVLFDQKQRFFQQVTGTFCKRQQIVSRT